MIDSTNPIELNGVKYKLAEGAEGEHFVLRGEPLRPPNAVVVQGTTRQDLFQMRSDVLLWSLGDWSGGEGQYKYDPSAPNRWAFLRNVDPFSRPGTVRPGPALRASQAAAGGDLAAAISLVSLDAVLYGISTTVAGAFYTWDSSAETWSAGAFFTGDAIATNPTVDGVCSDDLAFYYLESTAGNVFSITNGGVATKMNAGGAVPVSPSKASLRELGDYIYAVVPQQGKVYEMAKSASGAGTWAALDDLDWGGSANTIDNFHFQVAVSENRLFYFYATEGGKNHIRRVTPTSAAGAGSAAPLALIVGVVLTSMWFAGGLLYLAGWQGIKPRKNRVLFYMDPETGDYGLVDRVYPDFMYDGIAQRTGKIQGNEAGAGFATDLMTWFDDVSIANTVAVYQHDQVGGGIAQLTCVDRDQADTAYPCVFWQGDVWQVAATAALATYRGKAGTYIDSDDNPIFVTSPWHDFGLADNKIFSSISIQHEALPADWELQVYYATDGNASYTLAGTSSTDGSTGEVFALSTDTSTVTFRTLQIQVKFVYTGAANPPVTSPVLLGLDVRAQVVRVQRVWHLLLDLSDDRSAGSQSLRGSKKYTNIVTAGASGAVVDFKEGYSNRTSGVFTAYDVIVDSYQAVLSLPGEGFVQVTLREVA